MAQKKLIQHELDKFVTPSGGNSSQSAVIVANYDGSSIGGGGGATTIADGADVTQGAIADAAVTTNTTGTISGKLRGLIAILADIWDSTNHRIKVDGSGVTQPISGTVTATQATGTNLHTVIDSGTVTANPTTPTSVKYARATISVTNTAVQLGSNAVSGVIIQALSGNAASIYVGDSSVTTSNGFELQAGQATSVAIDNTNRLYINGTASDGVCFIGS